MSDAGAIRQLLESIGPLSAPVPAIAPRYNIAPTQQAWVVVAAPSAGAPAPALALRQMAFGFRPRGMPQGVINARAETVADKPLFRRALARHRCLVLASGFFEWARGPGKQRRPYYFQTKPEGPLVFAGLHRVADGQGAAGGGPGDEFVIITTEANACVGAVHGRMPVLLGPAQAQQWLAAATQPQTPPHDLLRPYPADQMTALAVSQRVNSPRHDDVACLLPDGAPALFG